MRDSVTDAAIEFDGLTRDFGAVRALNGLTLTVPRGIIFGFLGPNGSGKTTAINLLLGLLDPTEGRASVFGLDCKHESDDVRARSGVLLEHSGLYEQITAEDNLEFYGRIWRLPDSHRRERVKELLTHLGLWERRKERVGNWSRGMKQRLAVARALIHRPPIVFLDEPTAGLDVIAAAEVRDDLAALVEHEGTTVFLTTHNMVEAERLCSQVAVIRAGSLIAAGAPDELRARAGGLRIEIVGRGMDDRVLRDLREREDVAHAELRGQHASIELVGDTDTAPLVSFLVDRGVAVEEVRRAAASLEDVFLTLMEEQS